MNQQDEAITKQNKSELCRIRIPQCKTVLLALGDLSSVRNPWSHHTDTKAFFFSKTSGHPQEEEVCYVPTP